MRRLLPLLSVPLLFCVLVFLAPGSSARTIISGEVVGISDGDTLRVLDASRVEHKVRLAWVDAPERDMPFGNVSRQALAQRVFRQQVSVEIITRDRYGRLVGLVRLGEQDINFLQVRDGLAWHYQYYARKDQDRAAYRAYADAEQEARASGRGLWRDAHPVPPWDWRKQRRTTDPAS